MAPPSLALPSSSFQTKRILPSSTSRNHRQNLQVVAYNFKVDLDEVRIEVEGRSICRPQRHLHVWELLRVLDRFWIDWEQVLASRLLPFGEGSGLEGGDSGLSKTTLLGSLLLLHGFPLGLADTIRDVFHAHGGTVGSTIGDLGS